MLSNIRIDILPSIKDLVGTGILGLVLLILFVLMAGKSTMLREPGQGISLGRTQMAWWTLLSIWGFVFIYRFTGEVAVTKSVVILMSISSVTALAAVFIDTNHAPPSSGPPPPAQARKLPFLRSLLADPTDPLGGLSLHRTQVVLWTLVMSYVYLASVVGRFVMPEFDSTLLALMGVSSGTYLGFKVPERNAAQAAAATHAPPPKEGSAG